MSFEDYARYVSHKLRLAISIAVIRSRPSHVSLEDHVQNIRQNISSQSDFEFSITSEDFNIDDRYYNNETDDENSKETCPNEDDNVNQANGNEDVKNSQETEAHDLENNVSNEIREYNNDIQEVTTYKNHLNKDDETDDIKEIDHCESDNDIEMKDAEDFNDSINVLQNYNFNENNSTEKATAMKHQTQSVDHNYCQQLTENIRQSIDIECTETVNINYSDTKIVTKFSFLDNETRNNSIHIENSLKEVNSDKKTYQNDTWVITDELNNDGLHVKSKKNDDIKRDTSFNRKIDVDLIKNTDATENNKSININELNATDTQTDDHNSQDIQNTHYSETQYNDLFVIENKYIHSFRSKVDNKLYISIKNIDHIKRFSGKDMDRELISNEENNDAQRNVEKTLLLNDTNKKNNINDDLNTTKNIFPVPSYTGSKQIDTDTKLNSSPKKTVAIENVCSASTNQNKTTNGQKQEQQNSETDMDSTLYEDIQLLQDDSDMFYRSLNRQTTYKHNLNSNRKEECNYLPRRDSLISNSLETLNDNEAIEFGTQHCNTEKENRAQNVFTQCSQKIVDLSAHNNYEDLSKAIKKILADLDKMTDDITKTNNKNENNLESNQKSTNLDDTQPLEGANITDIDKNTIITQNLQANIISNENEDMECQDTNTVLINFEILEVMNKVKKYLAKKSLENYSNETGYRSDSHSKNASLLSQTTLWLNQSAESLSAHCLQQPLLESTADITNEISNVLGDLIDRLCEEEGCPPFLDGFLKSVERLLKSIYEDTDELHPLQVKDDSIQRLFLLTKSLHMQTFTIDKITNILQELNGDMTNKPEYEIENIDKAVNVGYIFDILETLLRKYIKNAKNLSQTQNSQERLFKKCSIYDIWRKKWNCNVSVAEEKSQKSGSAKKFELTQCSDALNKLIVNCMDGYSLMSFFALRCFNVMQK